MKEGKVIQINKDYLKVYDDFAVYSDIYQELNKAFLEKTTKNKEEPILDFGCGTGNLTLELLKRDYKNITAVDIDEASLQLLKEKTNKDKWKENIIVKKGDIRKINLPKNKYKTILARNVIYLLDEPEKCISELSKSLKKGGRIIISGPEKSKSKGYLMNIVKQELKDHGVYEKFEEKFKTFSKSNKKLFHQKMFKSRQIIDELWKNGLKLSYFSDEYYAGVNYFIVAEKE